jgi:hypothetical protein
MEIGETLSNQWVLSKEVVLRAVSNITIKCLYGISLVRFCKFGKSLTTLKKHLLFSRITRQSDSGSEKRSEVAGLSNSKRASMRSQLWQPASRID